MNEVKHVLSRKEVQLFLLLGGFFITNALVAEMIGGKLFSVEKIIGIEPVNWTLFGQENLSFTMTCGVLLWPVVFVMTDIINEYFGMKGVRFLSFLTVGLILYAFGAIYLAMGTPAADFYINSNVEAGIPNMNVAFSKVFGQGLWIIAGSVVAFIVGQIIDVFVFHRIRKVTGEGKLWLRANASTLVSQIIDSFLVLFIAFYLSGTYPLVWVLAVGVVNLIYKMIVALLLTPFLYVLHAWIDRFLGKELSAQIQQEAAK